MSVLRVRENVLCNSLYFASKPLNGNGVNEAFTKLADGHFTAKISAENARSSLRMELSEAKAKTKEVSLE